MDPDARLVRPAGAVDPLESIVRLPHKHARVTAKWVAERLRLHEEFVTVEVDNGSRTLEAAKNEYFDAILLDDGLPDMDGRLARLEISASIVAVDTVRMGNASSWRRPNRGRPGAAA